jgi:hypothetical protein
MQTTRDPIIHAGFSRCASTFLLTHVFPKLKKSRFIEKPDYADLGQLYLEDIPSDSPIHKLGQDENILISEKNYTAYNLPLAWRKYGHRLRADIFISNITNLFRQRGKLLFIIRRQDDLIESVMRMEHAFMKGKYYFLDFPVTSSIYDNPDIKIYKKERLSNRHGITYTHTYDYFDIFRRLSSKIDKQRIHILLYEDLKHDPQKFYKQLGNIFEEDLTSIINQVLPKERESKDESAIVSPSLRKYMVNQKYSKLRKIVPPGIKKAARAFFSNEIHLEDSFRQDLMKLYTQNNQRLGSDYNLDLKKYGYH